MDGQPQFSAAIAAATAYLQEEARLNDFVLDEIIFDDADEVADDTAHLQALLEELESLSTKKVGGSKVRIFCQLLSSVLAEINEPAC